MAGAAPAPAGVPLSLFAIAVFYGGMVCIAGVLGVKQVAMGPLAVEGGIFAFLLLVVMSSAVTELHGPATARRLVLFGFVPLVVSMLLIRLVLVLPADAGMHPDAVEAFPVVVGQGARMMLAGLVAYGVSQTLNVTIFAALRGRGDGRMLWLRAAVAGTLSQIVDTLLFIAISFVGERPIAALLAGQMAAKVTLSILLVPFLVQLVVRAGRQIDGASRPRP